MYTIKKSGGMWTVVTSNGLVMFSSLKRINCTEWVRANAPSSNAPSTDNQ